VTGLAFPGPDLVVFEILGLTAGLVALARVPSRRGAAGAAVAFAAGLFGVLLSWSARFGAEAAIGLVAFQALLFLPVGLVAGGHRRRRGRAAWAWAVAAAWVLVDALRIRWPVGGFEWGQLGFVWHDLPVRSIASLVGTLGLTGLTVAACAWVAAVAAGLPAGASGTGRRAAAATALLAVALVTGSELPWTRPAGDLDVTVVQIAPVCDGPVVSCPSEDADVLAAHVAQTAQVTGAPDLLVWGEGALGGAAPRELGRAVVWAAGRLPAPLLAGATSAAGPGRWFNRNVLYGRDGEVLDTYAKRHPVPFGEYVPARALLGGIGGVGTLVPSDMVPGTEPGRMEVDSQAFGTVSSLELSVGREMRAAATGTGGVVGLTLEASYGRSAVSDQLLAIVQLRAAELRKPVLVAATTGRSTLVGADGSRGEATGLLSAAVLSERMQLRSGSTPFERFGDLPAVLAALAVLAGPMAVRWEPSGRVRGTAGRRRAR